MADSRGEYWYFDPSIDGTKITVPELRSILLKHGVTYPASAKKPVLVALFQEQVLPQAAKVQRAHARTKRSTRGIVDVPSSSASTTDDTNDEETLIAPTPARRTRRTTRATTEEDDEPRPTPSRRSKTPMRTIPTKHARETETEVDEQPALRRTRKSVPPTPIAKEPTPDPEAWHRQDAASPFTQENPFQSGSSPAGLDALRERRRKSAGNELKERRKSDFNRRKTFQPKSEQLDHGIVVPSRKTFEPYRRIKPEEVYEVPDNADAGEEFEPDEQLELVRERAKNGEMDILPPRRRKRSTDAAGTLKTFSVTLLTLVFAVFGALWRQEKYNVGFCGVGQDASTSLGGVEVPDFAIGLLPQCEPCPPHAMCYRDMTVECDKQFVKKEHPLSLNGLLPLPPTCEPDTETTRRINTVADKTVKILRTRKAQYECHEPDAQGKIPDSPEISVEDIKKEIYPLKRKGWTDEAFNEIFDNAIGEAAKRDEVVESNDGSERRLASTSLAELSLTCSIRRSLRETLERHILTIVIMVLSIATGSYGKYSFTKNRAMEARAKQLASDVFDRLANQAALAHDDSGGYNERGLSMNQLRDDVLRNEFSAARRIKLWERVQKKVEHNSNVRAAVREGQSGDITRMWEWIGPVQLLDDVRSPGRRSGRQSMGWSQPSSPPQLSSPLQHKELRETKHWDEGHAMY